MFVVGAMSEQRQKDFVSALFVQNSPRIRGFILTLVPNMEFADDVLQETFLTVTSKADDFARGSNFVAWACRIAQFKVLEESRSRSRKGGILSPEVIEAICSSDSLDIDSQLDEQLEALKHCLHQLAPHAQQAFELRYKSAHKVSEIAKILDWSVDSVSVILSRGRNSLRNCVTSRLEMRNGF